MVEGGRSQETIHRILSHSSFSWQSDQSLNQLEIYSMSPEQSARQRS